MEANLSLEKYLDLEMAIKYFHDNLETEVQNDGLGMKPLSKNALAIMDKDGKAVVKPP